MQLPGIAVWVPGLFQSRVFMTSEMMSNAAERLNLTIAIFADGARLILVNLDEDTAESASANAVAGGWKFAGSIAVVGGVPSVDIQPGFNIEIAAAGAAFAELLGPMLKREQLKELEKAGI
jgi:hypothetical protein